MREGERLWAIGYDPLCTRMYPPPGAAPGPPVKTGARVRRFRGCYEQEVSRGAIPGSRYFDPTIRALCSSCALD